MFMHLQGYDSVKLNVIEGDGKGSPRLYVTPQGKQYPSITSVLSVLSEDSIAKWKARVGEEEANKIGRKAATRGTKIHNMCEAYINNDSPFTSACMPNDVEMFNQIKSALDEYVTDVFAQEVTLYSDKLQTAGRCDLIAKFLGKPAIIDFKTSKKEKKPEWISGYFQQTTAYAMMFEEMHNVPIEHIVIIIACEDTNQPQIFVRKKYKYIDDLMNTRQLYKDKYNI
jgi:hypothetical protein